MVIAIAIIQMLLVLLTAPLARGLLSWFRQRVCGQCGASVVQPYRDLIKLFQKRLQTSQQTEWLAWVGPGGSFIAMVAAISMVPFIHINTLGGMAWGDDLLLLSGLLLLSKFIQSLMGLDSPACFSGLGSGRVMLVHSVVEPVILIVFFALSLDSGTTSFSDILRAGPGLIPARLAALTALALALLMECGRMPYDNPATHLELTMIEKAVRIERSGPDLALAEWGESLKLLLAVLLISNLLLNMLFSLLINKNISSDWLYLFNVVIAPLLLWLMAVWEMSFPRYRLGDLPKIGSIAKGLGFFSVIYVFVIRFLG